MRTERIEDGPHSGAPDKAGTGSASRRQKYPEKLFAKRRPNEFTIEGKTVKVHIRRKNKPPVFMLIDLADWNYLQSIAWSGNVWVSPEGYAGIDIGLRKHARVHRLITRCPKGMVVDHLNHNPLDNRRENLRIASYSENGLNRKGTKNETGFRGVFINKRALLEETPKYMARVLLNKKVVWLGAHHTPEAAAQAVKDYLSKQHGIPAPADLQQ